MSGLVSFATRGSRSGQKGAHLQLVRGEGSVGGGETENVGDTGSRQSPDTLVLMCEQIPLAKGGGNVVEGGGVDLVLVEALQLLRQSLQTVEQCGDGDGLAGAPGELLVEL
jgi:hypothetical protein